MGWDWLYAVVHYRPHTDRPFMRLNLKVDGLFNGHGTGCFSVFLKRWFPNEQRQPHLGDGGQKNVSTCGKRSLCPSCVRKTDKPMLYCAYRLLVTEQTIISNRWSPLRIHQQDGDEVVKWNDEWRVCWQKSARFVLHAVTFWHFVSCPCLSPELEAE